MRDLWKGGWAVLSAKAVGAAVVSGSDAQTRAWSPKLTQPAPCMSAMNPRANLREVPVSKDPSVGWRHNAVSTVQV